MNRLPTRLTLVALFLSVSCAPKPKLGDPLPGLTAAERDQFERGRAEFVRVFAPETGLGPAFNGNACIDCHEDPVAGGPGEEDEVHVSAFREAEGFCDPLAEEGGPVIQANVTPALRAALGVGSEPIPREASTARRTSPDVFGFGLLDAVPESEILSHADPEDKDGDGISGRPNRFVDGRVGRFGRKGFVPTLREFNDGALVIEMGITSPSVPTEESFGGQPLPEGTDSVPDPEVGQEVLDRLNAFVRFLAPPPPQMLSANAKRGQDAFGRIGCNSCHIPTLRTGDDPSRALRYRNVPAYTDLLLHDMGEDMADICLGQATPSEFRTEPLMGLSLSENIEEGEPRFLHDGRAKSIDEAIRLHGGEAARSRDRFLALSEADRAALVAFLRAL
jgi:CxxC motif-containing protein (DUF1111 family)